VFTEKQTGSVIVTEEPVEFFSASEKRSPGCGVPSNVKTVAPATVFVFSAFVVAIASAAIAPGSNV
jgi:hypothetical protein